MSLLKRLTPFFMLALILLIFSFGIMLVFYLLLVSFAVSLVLFIVNWVKMRFFHPRQKAPKKKPHQGRIIDSDDYRHL